MSMCTHVFVSFNVFVFKSTWRKKVKTWCLWFRGTPKICLFIYLEIGSPCVALPHLEFAVGLELSEICFFFSELGFQVCTTMPGSADLKLYILVTIKVRCQRNFFWFYYVYFLELYETTSLFPTWKIRAENRFELLLAFEKAAFGKPFCLIIIFVHPFNARCPLCSVLNIRQPHTGTLLLTCDKVPPIRLRWTRGTDSLWRKEPCSLTCRQRLICSRHPFPPTIFHVILFLHSNHILISERNLSQQAIMLLYNDKDWLAEQVCLSMSREQKTLFNNLQFELPNVMAIDLFTFVFHNHTMETTENANSIVRTETQLIILLIFFELLPSEASIYNYT